MTIRIPSERNHPSRWLFANGQKRGGGWFSAGNQREGGFLPGLTETLLLHQHPWEAFRGKLYRRGHIPVKPSSSQTQQQLGSFCFSWRARGSIISLRCRSKVLLELTYNESPHYFFFIIIQIREAIPKNFPFPPLLLSYGICLALFARPAKVVPRPLVHKAA